MFSHSAKLVDLFLTEQLLCTSDRYLTQARVRVFFLAGVRASCMSPKHGPLSGGRAHRLPEKKATGLARVSSNGLGGMEGVPVP